MKILFFNWRDITHPEAGGCELHLHEIAKRIVKKGHYVTIFCGTYPNAKTKDIIDGIKIIRKGTKYTVYIHALFTYLTKLRKKQIDIIIDDINGIAFFTPIYVSKAKIAIIHHLVRDIFSKELPIYLRPIGYFAEWLIPIVYRNINFITVSESSKKEMIQIGIDEQRINVIHNGISSKYKENLNLKTTQPSLCYIGRLKEYKQLDHLIKSLKIIKEKVPNIILSIAGSGETEEELKELVKTYDLEENVNFLGFINEKEKIILYQKSWVFINPSIKEGWGLTVIEANACGTPAIAYKVPGLNESIKNNYNGLLVEKIDYQHLATNILSVLKDEYLREQLTKNALNWSKKYSWDKSSMKFLEYLENVFKNE